MSYRGCCLVAYWLLYAIALLPFLLFFRPPSSLRSAVLSFPLRSSSLPACCSKRREFFLLGLLAKPSRLYSHSTARLLFNDGVDHVRVLGWNGGNAAKKVWLFLVFLPLWGHWRGWPSATCDWTDRTVPYSALSFCFWRWRVFWAVRRGRVGGGMGSCRSRCLVGLLWGGRWRWAAVCACGLDGRGRCCWRGLERGC